MATVNIDPRIVQKLQEARNVGHLANDCPVCGAPAGEQCVHADPSKKGARGRLKRCHVERLDNGTRWT